MSVEGHDTVAPRNALRNALRNTIRDNRTTMSTTPDRAQTRMSPKPDSLRSTRAGAIRSAVPARERWLGSSCSQTLMQRARRPSGSFSSTQSRTRMALPLANPRF